MAFKAIYSTEVFDEDRGITVKLPFRRNDSPNQITMCYSDPTVTFEFEIVFDVGPPVESALASLPCHGETFPPHVTAFTT